MKWACALCISKQTMIDENMSPSWQVNICGKCGEKAMVTAVVAKVKEGKKKNGVTKRKGKGK
jgi:hypothetical protein